MAKTQRWAIRFSVEGDLRFLSHHEMAGALELAAIRADLPLAYSQGFNPHPIMSLVCPRPVAVASREELLVLSLACQSPGDQGGAEAPPATADWLLGRLREQVPTGLRLLSAEALAPEARPHPVRIDYVLPLEQEQLDQVRRRLEELKCASAWPVERLTSPKGRPGGRATTTRVVDLKPMTSGLTCDRAELRWSAVHCGDAWAKPAEVLRLLGLDERVMLARLVRTAIECSPPDRPAQAAGLPPGTQ